MDRTLRAGNGGADLFSAGGPILDTSPSVAVGGFPGDDGAVVGNVLRFQLLEGDCGEFGFRQLYFQCFCLYQLRMKRFEVSFFTEVAGKFYNGPFECVIPGIRPAETVPGNSAFEKIAGDDAGNRL